MAGQINKSNKGIYIALISLHGLIRSKDMELGRDADTGGQILYVVELARALAERPEVKRVDLFTRMVGDLKVSPDYSVPLEPLSKKANIVRIPFGPKRYLRKEVLWPYLDGFIDQSLHYIRQLGQVPDVVHAHYADAGYVGARVAGLLGVPLVFTGHSLGRDKLKQLLHKGVKQESIQTQYHIEQRIEAEEIALGTADLVIASTDQEVQEQYASYENYHPRRMKVLPPGVNLERFYPPKRGLFKPPIHATLNRFLENINKPMILALSRADERKNITTLITAYGESAKLQKLANLVIIAGNRDDIPEMPKSQREVLQQVIMLIDKYDLYGKVAYPKQHASTDVPILYRLAARSKGLFVNPALTEPFGLTLIEAAASGLPIIATHDGGPKDIINYCNNGQLFDPLDVSALQKALLKPLKDRNLWRRWSKNGIKGANKYFSWPGHAQNYLSLLEKMKSKRHMVHMTPMGKSRLPTVDRLAFSALDNALFGNDESLQGLLAYILRYSKQAGFGLATGRTLNSAMRALKRRNIPLPDILITSVGTEIHYCHHKGRLVQDTGWQHHIDYRWQPQDLKKVLRKVAGLKLLAQSQQREHKISYAIDVTVAPKMHEIKKQLRHHDLHAKLILSEDKTLDILPIRASKGLAIRYISMKWGIPLERIFVAGDSGNDEEMLLGNTLAMVVANHSKELERLKGKTRIYFTQHSHSEGILEGLAFYDFLNEIRIPDELTELEMEEAYEEAYLAAGHMISF
ncbi:MAG: HAD-IIB family hydrolase [Gammaproteobacteria bacterium]|nr:HAD-IIB family hydrolase [Gammaproteobacteria bacterium]